jgi:hypothetical protein
MLEFFVSFLGFILFFIGLVLLTGFGWGALLWAYLWALSGTGYNPQPGKTKSLQKQFDGVHSVSGKLSAILIMIIGLLVFIYGFNLG